MHARSKTLADEPQPGDAGMSRFRHRPLHVEVKHGLGATGAFLGQPPPAGIAGAHSAVAKYALAHEIDIGVIVVSRPMALEIVEEGWPVGLKIVQLEIAQWKREAVVDPNQRWPIFS